MDCPLPKIGGPPPDEEVAQKHKSLLQQAEEKYFKSSVDPALSKAPKQSFMIERLQRPPAIELCENSCKTTQASQSKNPKTAVDPFEPKERIVSYDQKMEDKREAGNRLAVELTTALEKL